MGRDAGVTVGVLPSAEEISGIRRRRTPATSIVLGHEQDYLKIRGADAKSRKRPSSADAEVLELIRLLPETWANVIKICRVFGVRAWEVGLPTPPTMTVNPCPRHQRQDLQHPGRSRKRPSHAG